MRRSPLDSETDLGALFHFLHGSLRKLPHHCRVRGRSPADAACVGSWDALLPEVLGEVIRRVGDNDPRDVIACAAVCKRWREITKEIVRDWTPVGTGGITFLSCLKQPGPRDSLLQCLVEWNRKSSTFYLYLSPGNDAQLTDKGKFLLAARRCRKAAHIEYIISCNPSNFSRGSDSYFGKLRSDVFGINFTIYDGQPSCSVGHVSYKINLREPRGPRRIKCSLKCHSSSDGGGASPIPDKRRTNCLNPKVKRPRVGSSCLGFTVLRSKAPLWNENLKCFTLNFGGRATMSSTRNFQLIAPPDPDAVRSTGDHQDSETMILQFGKVRKDMYTMDYGSPLSAFRAFAICLTTFGWKFPCQ